MRADCGSFWLDGLRVGQEEVSDQPVYLQLITAPDQLARIQTILLPPYTPLG